MASVLNIHYSLIHTCLLISRIFQNTIIAPLSIFQTQFKFYLPTKSESLTDLSQCIWFTYTTMLACMWSFIYMFVFLSHSSSRLWAPGVDCRNLFNLRSIQFQHIVNVVDYIFLHNIYKYYLWEKSYIPVPFRSGLAIWLALVSEMCHF